MPQPLGYVIAVLRRQSCLQFSLGEGIDVGMDIGSPIDFTYRMPFAFTGKISHVTIDLGPLDVGEQAKAVTV